jgi:hypothetical protein
LSLNYVGSDPDQGATQEIRYRRIPSELFDQNEAKFYMQDQFWVDVPDLPVESAISDSALGKLFKIYYYLTCVILVTIPLFFLWYITGPVLAIAFAALAGLLLYRGYVRKRRNNAEIATAKSIQERARELTRAEHIGSAIHTAGHPLLSQNQPIVMALRGDRLSIYTYESFNPIDTILISQIDKLQTVVYDRDRIPHVEVIDKTAQALQLVLRVNGKEFVTLFRRFRNLKAIDWYHAIQKARNNLNDDSSYIN